MSLPTIPNLSQAGKKSFWKKPEGKMGAAFLAIGGASALYFGGPLLITLFGTLVTLLGQGIAITALAGVLALMLMVGTNKKFQTIVKMMFQRSMRAFTGFWIQLDALGIMKSYIDDLQKKFGVITKSIEDLSGQRQKAQAQVDKNEAEYTKEMEKASYANRNGQGAIATVALRQAERMRNMNDQRLKPMVSQIDGHLAMLKKYRDVTEIVMIDLKNEVQMQEQQASIMKATWGAISAAKSILQGGNDEREMFDEAMQYMADDYASKIGMIDNFIDSTKSMMDSIDIQNGIMEERGLQRLAEWEAQVNNITFKSSPVLEAPAANPLAGLSKVGTEHKLYQK